MLFVISVFFLLPIDPWQFVEDLNYLHFVECRNAHRRFLWGCGCPRGRRRCRIGLKIRAEPKRNPAILRVSRTDRDSGQVRFLDFFD